MKKFLLPLLLACLLPLTACSQKTKSAASTVSSSSSTDSSAEFLHAVESEASSDSPSSSSVGNTSVENQASSSASSKQEAVSLTFPEGFTLVQVGARLEAHHICKSADFIKSAQTYNFSYYPLVSAIPSSSKRAYRLEGYLYPDTYTLYTNMKPQDVIGKFLRNAEQGFSNYHYSGMTSDQLITLASIIEREADNPKDMKLVSSVFHNRLRAGQRLEADSTRDYCTRYLLAPNGPFSDSFKYYYNTYRCMALPEGPICNPGTAALDAAAHPASTDSYYFITAKGNYYYQKTMAEHQAKLKELGMA